MGLIRAIKELLKRILPPPVKAFNREIERVLSVLEEQNKKLSEQQSEMDICVTQIQQGKATILQQMKDQQEQLDTLEKNYREQEKRSADGLDCLETFVKKQSAANDNIIQEHESLKKDLERVRNLSAEAARQASEAVWAQIFNNTITESTWLNDKSFSPGRWAVGYPYLYVMYRVLNETHPKKILELGLGQSTRMIAQYAAAFDDVEHIVVEQDLEWINFFQQNYSCPVSTKLLHVPAEEINFLNDDCTLVYRNLKEKLPSIQFDFMSIDGPGHSRSQKYRRIDALKLIPQNLSDSFCVLMDDVNDEYCNNAYQLFAEKLYRCCNNYCMGKYIGRKTISIITSYDKKFLCSL
ncbi:hypothetical protein RWV98_12510 [Agathobaculum sp. NTUH-O15-33]|uniref:hypothetical protein n=1 Tax=Agathobaculum sp. NTUH-O15-33 TaxID=3079302 RepID=UPI0029586080|nr:hypothetical protein [Agathobaculum sp. NTUH-O15-33]WNX83431.1 hypothetical protein RWV98_12510 [Agathobaculum sp. NTUH-O15-33]